MKIRKKIAALICVATILMSLAMVGCGQKQKVEDFAKGYANLYIKSDTSSLTELGFSEDTLTAMIDKNKELSKKQTKQVLLSAGLTISDEQLDKIINSGYDAFAKLDITVEKESEEKNTAKVKITINRIDVMSLDIEAANEAFAELNGSQDKAKLIDTYINKFSDKLNNAQPSSGTSSETFDFELENVDVNGKTQKMWVPADSDAFAKQLFLLAGAEGEK